MKRRPLQNILLFVVATVLLSLLVLSCDGDSDDDDERAQKPPVFPPVVFLADKDTNGIDELYAAFDDGSDIVKLSDKLVAGGNVVAFLGSPDGFFVAYVADQNTDGVFELYAVVVDKTTGDTAVKVSGTTMAGSGILRLPSGEYMFDWAADSSRVAYIADQDTAGVFELFTSTPDGIENDLVSDLPDPPTGRDVKDFEWEPDSTLIAYVADQDTDDKFELYVSPSDSNTGNRKVSGIPMVGGGVREDPALPGGYLFGWAPDSSRPASRPAYRLAYIADQDRATTFELFTSTPDGVGNKKVSGSMGNNGDVDEFAWAPDNSKIAYLADQENDIGIELYTAFPDVGANPLKNSNGLKNGSNVTGLQWAPNSLRIAFIANKLVSRFALYTTSRADSVNVLVSSVRLDDSEVTFFDWAPDGSRIAYIADDFRIDVLELFTTLPDLPEVNRISGKLVENGDVLEFEWAPDSSRVAYTADQDENDVAELYTSTPDGRVNDIVSGVMVPGGNVQDFKWASDSSGVGYRADQDIDEVIELFASQPNGNENTKLSGTLVNGGNVLSFDWVP
jgi:Tol biopolymer transport system component